MGNHRGIGRARRDLLMLDSLEHVWQWIAGFALTAWLTVLSWLGKRALNDIRDLEKSKANKDSTDIRFERMFAKFDIHEGSVRAQHHELSLKIDELGKGLARIEGYMKGAQDNHRRDRDRDES